MRHIELNKGAQPIYLRYPLRIKDKHLRQKTIFALTENHLGATTSFPSAVVEIPQLNQELSAEQMNTDGGKTVADQIITLPTHPYVTTSDQDKIVSLIKQIVQ